MASAQLLSAVGITRPSKRGGFCPACRLLQSGDTPQEIAAPALVSIVVLLVAGLAWAVTIARWSSMGDMRMGLGSIGAFVAGWTVMVAAMMLPSATPLMFEFARNAEGRRGWRAATGLVGLTYLGVWLAFGVGCFALYTLLGMPWPNQGLIGGAALLVAGCYAFTPAKRACEVRCRELAALHGPLPFKLTRSAVVAGARYGWSCLGCNAALMLALVLVGLSNLAWMIALSAVMLAGKLAPPTTQRWTQWAVSALLVSVGLLYLVNS
jgi:predicted metal-binding membrane protein